MVAGGWVVVGGGGGWVVVGGGGGWVVVGGGGGIVVGGKTPPFIFLSIHDLRYLTLAYTPYLFGAAHPYPQLVAPSRYHLPLNSHTSGPPLSPWQASTPPWSRPAHNMESWIFPGYPFRHRCLETRGTEACIKAFG